MKLIVLLLCITSMKSWSQTKITKLTYDNLGRMTRMAPGFNDSTFDYKRFEQTKLVRFCFSGDAYQVCSLIEAFVAKKMSDYTSGDHDYIELNKCEPDDTEIDVSYTIGDDYQTEYYVTKKIENCTKVILED